MRERTAELHETQLEVVARLGAAAEWRDDDTGEHIERIGPAVRAPRRSPRACRPSEAETLRHAARLHDVGKIGVPDRVLLKPGRLDAEEWAIMKTHAEIGASMLAGSPSPLVQLAEAIARTHHERWDGSGYPAGLRGEEIPLAGRICAICDVFDALLSARPYKDAVAAGRRARRDRRPARPPLRPGARRRLPGDRAAPARRAVAGAPAVAAARRHLSLSGAAAATSTRRARR